MEVAVVLQTTGHRFDPCRVYKKGGIGRVLIVSVKHRLGGSIPSAPTSERCRFESVSSLIGKTTLVKGDGGSSPSLV